MCVLELEGVVEEFSIKMMGFVLAYLGWGIEDSNQLQISAMVH